MTARLVHGALCAGLLLMLGACGDQPKTESPATAMNRLIEENHKASEALVHAARDHAESALESMSSPEDAQKKEKR